MACTEASRLSGLPANAAGQVVKRIRKIEEGRLRSGMFYFPEALTNKLTSLFFYRQRPLDRFVTGIIGNFGSDTLLCRSGLRFGSDAHNFVKEAFGVVQC